MVEIRVFTDGGGFAKEEGEVKFDAVSAFRIFIGDEFLAEFSIFAEDRTCAFGEINAIAMALEKVHEYVEEGCLTNYHVKLYTDSMIYYRTLKEWIFGWLKKIKGDLTQDFIGSAGQVIANQDAIKQAFRNLTKLRKEGKVELFHINSHVSEKKVKKLKEKFEKFNKCKISDDDFLFAYLQNKLCDQAVKKMYEDIKGNTEENEKVNE